MKDIEKLDDKKEKLGNKKIHEILSHNKVRYINFIEWEVIDKEEGKWKTKRQAKRKIYLYRRNVKSINITLKYI